MKKEIRKKNETGKKAVPVTGNKKQKQPLPAYLVMAFVLTLTLIAYIKVAGCGFVWDDELYVTKNNLILSIDLKAIFSSMVAGNYHPVTILMLAIEYKFFGMNPAGYHVVNLFIHMLNTWLAFVVVRKIFNNVPLALITALLFGIHPLHVESVAWVSEIKDLLYTFFFLLSYYFYLKYMEKPGAKLIILSLMFFILSLLSKAMAAPLPAVLILTDYLKGRKINMKTLAEKAPFFLAALVVGLIAVYAQKDSDAIPEVAVFGIGQRAVFAAYGFIMYLYKMILPLHLCAIYPYPNTAGTVPGMFYIFILLFFIVAGLTVYSLKKTKVVFFGMGFFTLTVFLVLQLLPVGSAIMADRYAYVPSLGIFIIAAHGWMKLWNRKSKYGLITALGVFTLFFTIITYSRCDVWKDGLSFWNDIIAKYQTIPHAYYNRGYIYMNSNKPDLAIEDFTRSVELRPDNKEALVNRGNMLKETGRKNEALNDYNAALKVDSLFPKAFFNRGTLFAEDQRNAEAMSDFTRAIMLDSNYMLAYFKRGNVYYSEKSYEKACSDYNRAIKLKDDYPEAYYNRGLSLYFMGNAGDACMDIKKSADLGYRVPANIHSIICEGRQ